MEIVWSFHAESERLPERSSYTREEIEYFLQEGRCVIDAIHPKHGRQDNHLIWDSGISSLINVPILKSPAGDYFIPTVLPVTEEKSGFDAYILAHAEMCWLGQNYYREYELADPHNSHIKIYYRSGGENSTQIYEMWFLEERRDFDEANFLPLLRQCEFINKIREYVLTIQQENKEGGEIIVLKNRCEVSIPVSFFLEAL